MMMMILIIILGSVYSIILIGLLIKFNKIVCFYVIVKINIIKLLKWDFVFMYLFIVILVLIIIFVVWILEDFVIMMWLVLFLF